MFVVTISSPGAQRWPKTARFMPSVVLRVSATLAGSAPIRRASAARASSLIEPVRAEPPGAIRPRQISPSSTPIMACWQASGMGPYVPVFR